MRIIATALLLCVIFITHTFGQTEKTLLTPLTTALLANEICDCLKKDSTVQKNYTESIKKCYTSVILRHGAILSTELGINFLGSNDFELGKKVGGEIAKVLAVNCPIYSQMITSNASQNIVNQAEELRKNKKFEEAIKRYNAIFSDINIDKTVFNARGLCKYELDDYYGALADFEYAIQKDSMYAAAYSNRGLAKSKLDKSNDALKDYNKAIELDSNLSISYSNRGVLYYENQYYDDAEKDLKKAIQKDTIDEASNYYYLAQTKRLNKQLTTETAKYYDKAIELSSKSAVYLNDRGLFYWDKNDLQKAKIDFLSAIKIDKNLNSAYYNLSQLASQAKQYDEALKYVDEAIKIDTTYDIYFEQKGKILLSKNNQKNALKAFDKAIAINDSKAEYYDEIAEAYEKLGDYPNAIKNLSTSIGIYNQDGKIYYRRAMLYLKTKNKKAACEDLLMGQFLKDDNAIKAIKLNCQK